MCKKGVTVMNKTAIATFEIIDDKYRILTNDNNSTAQKCYWKNGKYITENIICTEFKNVEELYEK